MKEGSSPLGAADLYSVDSDLRFLPSTNNLAGGPSVLKRWLHIDDQGSAQFVEVDKHRLVQDLNVRYRDLLTLDPTVPIPYPSSLLIREKALVINLETIRMIIGANQCYVLSVPKEGYSRLATTPGPGNPFVRQLCRVLRAAAESRRGLPRPSFDYYYGMPYELRALECALAAATRLLDDEVLELEREAYPAIDRMAVSVSREVLEDVRAAKSSMNRLIGRVQRLKQEIEEILADDSDMQDMYLGRRAALTSTGLPSQPPPSPPAGQSYKTVDDWDGHPPQAPQQQPGRGEPEPLLPPPPSPRLFPPSPRPAAAAPSPFAAVRAANGGAEGLPMAAAEEGEGEGEGSQPGAAGAAGAAAGKGFGALNWERGEERRALERTASSRSLSRQRSGGSSGRSKPHRRASRRGGGNGGEVHEKELRGRGGTSLRQHSLVIRTVRRLHHAHSQRQPLPQSPRAPEQQLRRRQTATRGPEGPDAGAAGSGAAPARAASQRGGTAGGTGTGGDSESESDSGGEGEGEGQGVGEQRGRTWGPAGRRRRRAWSPAGDSEAAESSPTSSDEPGSLIEETVVEHPAGAALVDPHDIEEAEDLLESSFLQVDYLLRRLMLLKERTDDTEDLVNIEMDHRRNELVALDLLVTCITAAFTFVAMVAGIFGMNLFNASWENNKGVFIWTMILTGLGAIALLAVLLLYIRKRRLMFISTL